MSKPVNEQTILITGATDGIGKLTAAELAKRKARLIVHGRDDKKIAGVIKELTDLSDNKNIDGLTYDFVWLQEVRKMADHIKSEYSSIDVLINNAGVWLADRRYSNDGYELRFAVNYLAPFLLTQLLLPLLIKSAPSRIVNVSSVGQHKLNFDDIMMENNFDAYKAYSQSKLALIMYTFELADRLKGKDITVNALHPGTLLNTKMVQNAGINPRGNPETGADAEVYLAASEELQGVTGKYFDVKKESRPDSQAYDREARKRLWKLSLELTNLREEELNEYTR